ESSDVRIGEGPPRARLLGWMAALIALLGLATLGWRRYRRLPRWMGPILFLLVHGALPWALASLTRRPGWSARGPGRWNLVGLPLVGARAALAIWGFALHLAESPEGLAWERTRTYLLRRGPYAVSRNPMYLGELALWLGWAVFHGSIAV